jgi:hypothetical protein
MAENATITIRQGDSAISFPLDGFELSITEQQDGSEHVYLSNASRDYIAEQVEKSLIAIYNWNKEN